MKSQNLFSGKNKKNITNMSSAELALIMVKAKMWRFKTRAQLFKALLA